MKKIKLNELFSKDYRYYICVAITLGFLGCGFLFPNALPRVAESFRDLWTSFVYYIYDIFIEDSVCPVRPTVMSMPSWQWTESPWEALTLFPWTWEEFKVLWGDYWSLFISGDNFFAYCESFSNFFEVLAKVLTAVLPLLLPIIMLSKRYTEKKEIEKAEEDEREALNSAELTMMPTEASAACRWFERFIFVTFYPAARWIKSFVDYVMEEEREFFNVWCFLWLLYFNIISIGVSFFSFYMYFVVEWNFTSIYTQLLKLLIDLAPMIRFLPGILWFCIGYLILDYVSKKTAYAKLEHNERKNRGFLNERGVVTVIYGNMGTGKTRMLTSLALSAEKQLRDQALEIMLEVDMKFQNFPWHKLRAEVKRRMEEHTIVDIFSIRRWIRAWKADYLYLESRGLVSWFRKKIRKRKCKQTHDFLFDYDIDHYRTTYNDNLTITHIFDAMSDYAQAYFVYAIQVSLIFSNYSIRTDFDVIDNGHFPLYNDDFFHRKPEYIPYESKYAHILDFDILRLGKRMVEDNPNKNALGFGVYIVSEIDKERKNELQIRKAKTSKKSSAEAEEECTQDNDLFNACLKMIRHCTVIANRVFVKVLCDLQRPEDWGASGREVGEVVFIDSKGEKSPVLPLFSPYWIVSGLSFIHSLFFKFYLKYINVREDNTLLLYLFKNVTAFYDHYLDRNEKLFGCQVFNLEIESGRLDGDAVKRKFYGMDKKDFSGRYCTDAMSSIFDLPNTVSIADFVSYADILATASERDKQHSHFQSDINKYIAA